MNKTGFGFLRLPRRNPTDDKSIGCELLKMWEGAGEIQFGIYACAPEESSFEATFQVI